MDSSMFKLRFCEARAGLLPAVVLLPIAPDRLLLLMLWLNSCQGTGINLPVIVPTALLGVPATLERLDGTVSRPEVDVSDAPPAAPPADERERIAN